MPQLLFGYLWNDCPRALVDYFELEEDYPSAVLLFDYSADLELLESEYRRQNPHVGRVLTELIKFPPAEILELIPKDVEPYAWSMFTLLLAW
jgi:hypothetical protein